jgi:GT2 family glycosyltransferase
VSQKLSVAVGLPSMGTTHILWAHMYSQLLWPVSIERHTLILVKAPIATARNNMAITALERGVKYLFFIDDDVLIPGPIPRRLINFMENNDDVDAITGIYGTKTAPPEPLIFAGDPDNTGAYWDWRMGEIFPIWGAGLGCCLIRVSAFEKIEEPFFAFTEDNDGLNVSTVGEDLYFFRKLAAAGGKVMADGAALCAHMDRDSDKVYSLWKESKPYKNAIPEFLDDPLATLVPENPVQSVITQPE